MQHIVYEWDVDDMVAFADHHAANSPHVVGQTQKVRWFFTFVFAGIAIAAFYFGKSTFAVAYGAFAACWLIFLPALMRRRYRRETLRLSQMTNQNHFGRRELTLENHHLRSRSGAGETTLKTSVLDHMEETRNYFYIYVAPNQAIVIPKQRILSGDLDGLISELGQGLPMRSLV